MSLADMPSPFLYRVFLNVESVRDFVALGSTCRTLLAVGRSRAVWAKKIEKLYGLKLQVDGRCPETALYDTYRETMHQSDPVRYWGVYTDGGCDEGKLQYWVDKMFVPNQWEPFCSEFGKNVNCVGVLVDGPLECDIQTDADRDYMIERCRYPASRFFYGHPPQADIDEATKRLQSCAKPELVFLLSTFYDHLEAEGELGRLLLYNIPPQDVDAEKTKLRELLQRMRQRPTVHSAGIMNIDEDTPRDRTQEENLCEQMTSRRLLYDSTYLRVAQSQPEQLVTGVVDSIVISRNGVFSCPCASGVLFMAQVDLRKHASTHESMMEAFKKLCNSHASTSFDDLSEVELVNLGIKSGHLPPIRQHKSNEVAQWAEFEQVGNEVAGPLSEFSELRPVVWFRFKAKDDAQHNDPNDAAAQAIDEDDEEDEEDAEDHSELSTSESEDGAEVDAELGLGHEAAADVDHDVFDESDDEEEMDDFFGHNLLVAEQNKLVMRLSRRVAGSVVLLKLIRPENRMEQFRDFHYEPNIDLSYILLNGKKFKMPIGVHYRP